MLYVHGSVYYGVGWHDPYYYGGGYGGDVVVVPNPPDRPDRPVTQPRPTPLPATGATSRPSIPAAPLTFCPCCDWLCDWSGSGRADSTCIAAAECEMQIDTLDEALGLHAYQLRA